MKKVFLKSFLIALATLSTGCAMNPAKSQNPPPDEEFTAIGMSQNKISSYDMAMKEAKSFCNRWSAVPNVINKDVKVDDGLMDIAKKGIEMVTKAETIGISDISKMIPESSYETKLTYKCYQ